MAIQAHLVELERKHKVLENELHEALVHLSTDDLQIVELKRRKLMVKDQIERLRHTADETLHYRVLSNFAATATSPPDELPMRSSARRAFAGIRSALRSLLP